MNSTIKSWLTKALSLTADGDISDYSLSQHQANAFRAIAEIDDFILAASTTGYGIPIRQGLKTAKASHLIFLSCLAKKASEIASAHLMSDSFVASVYSYITNYALFRISEGLELASQRADSSVNAFLTSNDLSLNFIHNIVQVRSLISENPCQFSDADHLDVVSKFFDQELPLADFSLTEDTVKKTAGVNSYYVSKVLSNPSLDFGLYSDSIKTLDPNSPYMYRIDSFDYYGASICLYRTCETLSYEDKLTVATDYLKAITDIHHSTLRIAPELKSTIFEQAPAESKFFYALTPKIADLDDERLYKSIGYAFSYSTSLGLGPTSGMRFTDETAKEPFHPLIEKLMTQHTKESLIYAAKLLHSPESLGKAAEDVQKFMQEMRI